MGNSVLRVEVIQGGEVIRTEELDQDVIKQSGADTILQIDTDGVANGASFVSAVVLRNVLASTLFGCISDYIGRENTMFIAFLMEGLGIIALAKEIGARGEMDDDNRIRRVTPDGMIRTFGVTSAVSANGRP